MLAAAMRRVPTLEAVLRAFLGRAHLHIELKSKQAALPQAVSQALNATGWVGPEGALTPAALGSSHSGSDGQQQQQPVQGRGEGESQTSARLDSHSSSEAKRARTDAGQTSSEVAEDSGAWAAPGLTITSFHLQQLQASRALLPHVRHAWLVQEVTPEVIKVS
jgi:hypothetical protein